MPVDIEGWVEVKKSSKWYGHKDLNDYGVVSGEISNVLLYWLIEVFLVISVRRLKKL